MILAYSYNQNLDQYTGFVVNLDRTVIHVGRSVVSQGYIRDLCKNGTSSDDMAFYRSASFELLEQEGRREFMRVLLGIFRYLTQSESSTMIGEHVK